MAEHLFSPLQIRDVKFKNRVWMSPMCQYSSIAGIAQDWHMVHLGARAVGGVGLVMVEASGVSREARISLQDMGLWNERHVDALRSIVQFIKTQGSVAGIQLAHAGRKASTQAPWLGRGPLTAEQGAWQVVGPSPISFDEKYPTPIALDKTGMEKILRDFTNSAKLALEAKFSVIELHMAHGYLLHEFLSPLSNQRRDEFGGSLENRMRFPLAVAESVRKVWPDSLPLFARISATDWVEGGWDLEQSVEFSRRLRKLGVDLIDCSSGGSVPHAKIPVGPGYQVNFASEIRKKAEILTAAVGMITEPKQANQILSEGQADVVFLGRALLRDPYWALSAAKELGAETQWPNQYLLGKK